MPVAGDSMRIPLFKEVAPHEQRPQDVAVPQGGLHLRSGM